MSENTNKPQGNNSEYVSFRDIFDFIWRLKWWIVASAIAALIVAFVSVRMQSPVFQRTSWIMLNRDDGSTGELSMLTSMTGARVRKKIDNELFILKSPSLMKKVVEELNLNTRYYQIKLPVGDEKFAFLKNIIPIKTSVEFYKDSPFEFKVMADSLRPNAYQPQSAYIKFRNLSEDGKFVIKEARIGKHELKKTDKVFAYGDTLVVGSVRMIISLSGIGTPVPNTKYICSWVNAFRAAENFVSNMNTEVQGNTKTYSYLNSCDVVMVRLLDNKPQRADDILNTLILRNNEESKLYSNLATINTINFIDERLAEISAELANAEEKVKEYQSKNTVIDLSSQANLTLSSDKQYQDKLIEVQLQKRILKMIADQLATTPAGQYNVIPSNVGVSNAGLNNVITQYNTLVAERNRLIANSSANNPRVLSMNSSLEDSKKAIEISIANLDKEYAIRERELENTVRKSQSKMTSMPKQQYEMQQLSRKLEIIEPLYLMLQQKREESQIAVYEQGDTFRIIEAAFGNPQPVSPKATQIYLIALILGCCLPPAVVWLRMHLRTKVETKKDVEDVVKAPIIATLPRKRENVGALIEKDGRDTFSEAFRMLRSNLKFLTDAKVFQVTSSIPGEGKSYVSANLALSISHIGKKVLLIGMDLRKPALRKLFPDLKVSQKNTVVSYLIGQVENPDDMVLPSGISENLDVVFAGPVPPNPTELLSSDKPAAMLEHFRKKYDIIIVDTTPCMPVSDSLLVNSLVDATLYIVRVDHTPLNLLADIQDVVVGRMKNLSIVLNDLNLDASKYRYGYGTYGYGYGYGAKHGYGYGETGKEE